MAYFLLVGEGEEILVKNEKTIFPDRYRHTFQFFRDKEGEEPRCKGEIERKEAVRHILRIMEKLGVPWKRTLKQLPGWRDSL